MEADRIGPTLAVVPPAGMMAGDVVVMIAHYRGSVTLSISETGGQSWTALAQATQGTTNTSRIFYTVFDGTWTANPSVTVGTGTEALTVRMFVFRGVDTSTVLDVAQTASGYAAPVSPFDVTVTGVTTNTDGAMVLAFWTSQDDNSWAVQADGSNGWMALVGDKVRNTGGTDNSIAAAYKITSTAGASGNITNRQVLLGGDAGTTHIFALRPATPSTGCNTMTGSAKISVSGYASNPAYDMASSGTGPTLAVVPPAGMVAGDVVVMIAHYRGSVTLSISEAGGQSWTALAQATQGAANTSRIFYTVFDGTWTANPSVTVGTGTESLIVRMFVFRGVDTSSVLDVSQVAAGYGLPGAGCDVTRTGVTTNTDGAMVLAFWTSQDDNSWDLQTDGADGWRHLVGNNVRNTGGTDNSISAAFKLTSTAGASGNITNRQVFRGCDAGTTHILALRPAP